MQSSPYLSINLKEKRNEKQQRTKRTERTEQERAACAGQGILFAEQGILAEGVLVGARPRGAGQQGDKVVQVKGKRKPRPMRSPYDVNGSYTGTPQEGERPVQDADDL